MTPKDVTEDVEQQGRPIRSRSSSLTLGRSLRGDNKGVVRHVEAFHRRTCFVHVVLAGGLDLVSRGFQHCLDLVSRGFV